MRDSYDVEREVLDRYAEATGEVCGPDGCC